MSKTRERINAAAEYAADKVPWIKSHWRELLIAALVLCALFAVWRWQSNAAEADSLRGLVEVGATIEASQARLDALDREATERRQQIKERLDQLADADKKLAGKRAELAKASAARVSSIPKDAAGVAAELTKLGFPAKAVQAGP